MDGIAELAVGNIVRHVLHIIREEDLSPLTDIVGELKLSAEDDVKDIAEDENSQKSSATPDGCLLKPLCCLLFLNTYLTQQQPARLFLQRISLQEKVK